MSNKLSFLFDLYMHFLQTIIDGIDICFLSFLKKLGINFSNNQNEQAILYH